MPSLLRAAATLAAAAIAAVAGAAEAHAAAPDDWHELQGRIAGPFPALLTRDGRFPDPVQFGATPGHRASPLLGYALIEAGLRTRDDAQVEAGLTTLNTAIRTLDRGLGPGAFDHFAIASAYNVARRELSDHEEFARNRHVWEAWLRKVKLSHLPKTTHYANKYLVEAVAVLELERTGLRSKVRGSALARIDESVRLAHRLINVAAPEASSRSATRIDGEPAYILSDPSNNSLAYHALSLGFLARAIELMGPAANGAARRTLRGVARATWGLSGPDGDLAYIGRSQGLSWTLSLAAYGAESAAVRGAGGVWGPRFQAVADRSLGRLATAYGNGPYGWWITPSHEAAAEDNGALDAYATGPSYAGLTLLAVTWAIDAAERHERRPARLAADSTSVSKLSGAKTAFTTVRRGDTWMAVRHSPSHSARDLRYDFGLVALKRPGSEGWTDVIRPRPHTSTGPDSAGPLLRYSGGYALPDSESAKVDRAGRVTLVGGYRDRRKRWLVRKLRFKFQPVPCGARITLPRGAGDLVSYSIFWKDDVDVTAGRLSNEHATVTATPRPVRIEKAEGGASATDATLTRTILHWDTGPQDIKLTICET